MARTNKTAQVLRHLKEHGSITSWEAINEYGVTRLSAVIFNLRKIYRIDSIPQVCTDRFGNTAQFTKYIFVGDECSDLFR